MRSTRDASIGFSSRRDTLFDGDISNSETIFDEVRENICTEDACEEGRMKVDDRRCTARGTGLKDDET